MLRLGIRLKKRITFRIGIEKKLAFQHEIKKAVITTAFVARTGVEPVTSGL